MKRFVLSIGIAAAFVASSATQSSAQASWSMASVQKVRGIPVFILAEPETPYERVGEVSDDDAASVLNALGGSSTYRTIKESADVIITNAERKKKKGKLSDYDAIIISEDGHTGTCIKFKS